MTHKLLVPDNAIPLPPDKAITAVRVVRCADGRRFQARQVFGTVGQDAFELPISGKTSFKRASSIAMGFFIHMEPENE